MPVSSSAPQNAATPTSLTQAEEEAAGRENRLIHESQRLLQSARQVAGRLESLRRSLPAQGSPDPELQRLSREVERTFLPVLDLNPFLNAAQTLRLQALQVRRHGIEQAERALAAYTASLQALAYQVDGQQQALTTALARQRDALQAPRPEPAKVMELRQRPPPPPPDALRPESVPNVARRGQKRVRMQASVNLSSDSNFFTGFSTNLSEGGLFIATVNHPPRGTPVELRFNLPNGVQVEVKGVVRWTREVNDQAPEIFPGVGVQFTEVSPQALTAIKQFVGRREPMFFPDP